MVRPRILVLFACAIGLSLLESSEDALAGLNVSVPPISGSKRSGASKIEREVRNRLVKEGLVIISDQSSVRSAFDAGADLLLTVTIKSAKKSSRYNLEGRLVDVARGSVIKVVRRSYKKSSLVKTGQAFAAELALAASSFEPSPVTQKANAPRLKEEDLDASEPDSVGRSRPSDSSSNSSVETKVDGAGSEAEPYTWGDERPFRIAVAVGTQAATSYSVLSGGSPTILSYMLQPLMAASGQLRASIPGTGAALEVEASLVMAQFNIQNALATPAMPTGSFLNLTGTLLYEFTLFRSADRGIRIYLGPLIGVRYATLSVGTQAPTSIVVGSTAIIPEGGLRLGLQLGSFSVETSGKFDILSSYTETPASTGMAGQSYGVAVAGAARYWLGTHFAFALWFDYEAMEIKFGGAGTRGVLPGSAPINNATILSGDTKAFLGLMLGI